MIYKRRNNVFERIGNRYSSFIDPDHFMGQNAFEDSWIAPATNISVNRDHYDLEIGLPGYGKKEINVSVSDGVLQIVAERKNTKKGDLDGKYIQKEMETDRLEKKLRLSSLIDEEHIESEFENGLLHVKLPIKSEKKNSKTIPIS